MAKYRPIYTRIWKDPDFIEYSPEDKLLFIYLCTNEMTTESGIYPLTPRTVANELGISYETVNQRFNNGLLRNVLYDPENKMIFVKKFLKYNRGGKPELKRKSIVNDYVYCPKCTLWEEFKKEYPEYAEFLTVGKPLDNGCGQIPYNLNLKGNLNLNLNHNHKGDDGRNLEKEKQQGEIFKAYEDNFGVITPMVAEKIKDMLETYSGDWVLDAMKISVELNKRNLGYVGGILERWTTEGKKDSKPNETQPTPRSVHYV